MYFTSIVAGKWISQKLSFAFLWLNLKQLYEVHLYVFIINFSYQTPINI